MWILFYWIVFIYFFPIYSSMSRCQSILFALYRFARWHFKFLFLSIFRIRQQPTLGSSIVCIENTLMIENWVMGSIGWWIYEMRARILPIISFIVDSLIANHSDKTLLLVRTKSRLFQLLTKWKRIKVFAVGLNFIFIFIFILSPIKKLLSYKKN